MGNFLKKLIEYLFYFFLFLLPWQTRLIIKEGILNGGHWEWGTISLYAIDIIFIILFLLFCFYQIISKVKSQKSKVKITIQNSKFKILDSKFQLLVIGFLLFVLLSCLWAKDKDLAFYWALRILQGVILFFLVQKINFDFIKAGFSLVFSGLIQSFLGISQFISQKVFASKWLGIAFQDPSQLGVSVVETAEGRLLRVYGSLSHPNILAGFLVFLIFISFILYFLIKKPWQKYFILFSTSLITMTLFLTYSRATWLALIISVIFFTLSLFKKSLANFRTPFFEFFGLVLIITLIFSGLSLKDLIVRIEATNRLETRSVNERILNFQRGTEIIKENFLFGAGIGNYTLALYKKYPNLISWDYQPAANIYLLILAELGIVGLVLFLLILYFSLSWSIISYWLSVISLLILGLFDHWLFSLSFGIILFWLALGLLWKTREKIS